MVGKGHGWPGWAVGGAIELEKIAAGSWVVAVGDELLSGHTVDTNSSWLAARLSQGPYPCSRIIVVADRTEAIGEELRAAAAGPAARVFCCGGLGPTPDDRTMAAVAQMLGVPLVEDPDALAHIRARARRQYEEGRFDSPEPNAGARKMARVPRGARVLRNPVGGAPPLAIELPTRADPRWLFVLPGVPAELRATFEQELEPVFLAGTGLRRYRELHFEGVPESTFFPALTELEHTFPEVDFGSYPQSTGGVIIRARSSDPNALEEALGALRRLAPAPPSD